MCKYNDKAGQNSNDVGYGDQDKKEQCYDNEDY